MKPLSSATHPLKLGYIFGTKHYPSTSYMYFFLLENLLKTIEFSRLRKQYKSPNISRSAATLLRKHMDNLVRGPARATKAPPTVICYICGRQFGSRSIEIHIPQCLKKWELENERLPKSRRRPPPPRPDCFTEQGTILGTVDKYAVNEAAWTASQAALVACEHCGRTF
ncbi:unnamed protein product, partial [Anisakis simplex]|uniref:Zinc finger protein 474 (inferred by orthology to a human protein) n=1 Tax=Anisakis simplex TaxID=6269 RepID=A0A0M3KDV2_ANISI